MLDRFSHRSKALHILLPGNLENSAFRIIYNFFHRIFFGIRSFRNILPYQSDGGVSLSRHDIHMAFNPLRGDYVLRQLIDIHNAAHIIKASHAAQLFRDRQDICAFPARDKFRTA